jgi:DNA-binding MarR family transcriptional regulator
MEKPRSDILRLMVAVNRLDGLYGLAAKVNGIKDNTLDLLCALDDGLAHTQKQICDEWLIPRTTLNTIVKECVKLGYLSLSSEGHTREKTILVTAAGRAYIRETMAGVYHAEQSAMRRTREEYPAPFISALERFVDCLQEEFEEQVLRPETGK